MTTENKVPPINGPEKGDPSTWWFALYQPATGRTARFRVEERGMSQQFGGTPEEIYCFTMRRRHGNADWNCVRASKASPWHGMKGDLMAKMLVLLGEGFIPDQRDYPMWREDGQRIERTIEENPTTIDFRDDSYRLVGKSGQGKVLNPTTPWPEKGWTTLKIIRNFILNRTAECLAAGYVEGRMPEDIQEDFETHPEPNMEPGDKLIDWTAYHFQSEKSDKVYSIELWARPAENVTDTASAGHVYFVTARHGKRNGNLKDLHLAGPTSKGMAEWHFSEANKKRLKKQYQKVDPAGVGIPQPQGKAIQPKPVPQPKPTPAPADATPPGVEFYCKRCSKPLSPRSVQKEVASATAEFSFGCHGLKSRRSMTATGLATLAARAAQGSFDRQRIAIFEGSGAVSMGTELDGFDNETASPEAKAAFGNQPTPGPAPGKPISKPPRATVNDPPIKVGTLVPDKPGIQTFGQRKVRFKAGEDED